MAPEIIINMLSKYVSLSEKPNICCCFSFLQGLVLLLLLLYLSLVLNQQHTHALIVRKRDEEEEGANERGGRG